ncbi:hypothetical protein [Streptomyces sp. V3I7]|uniref:hypothetical protein n=1 Tax=Streptomyces sp. V3I7 TaxID=3042278 RepID=UPI002780335F|nr:hypothetical protein [Streptomyces sp. V3I7]MDQ0989675.1 hypothetical protein [Streptomyces sp. V3I7]
MFMIKACQMVRRPLSQFPDQSRRELRLSNAETACCLRRQLGMVPPVRGGKQAGEHDDFGVGGHFDPGLGGAVGITERILTEHFEPAVPPLPKGLSASLTGEPPGQAVAGVDEG